MLSRPTTDQVLEAIADDLKAIVAPAVTDEQATVLLGQVDQLLRRLGRRAAHEIAWMSEEIAAIDAALGRTPDPTDSLHLADVCARYDAASQALGDAIDEAFAANDSARVAELRALLAGRVASELQVLGQLDLVGRG